jgi:DNA-binding transcriptional MerR regulator
MPTLEQFPIRTASAVTCVSTVTLRAGECRDGLLRPVRTPSGHRLYTHAHVELFGRLLPLLERLGARWEEIDGETPPGVDL